MIYLVDAKLVSEPTKVRPHAKAVAWLDAHEGDFVIDSIVMAELSIGVLAMPQGRKRRQLEHWLEEVRNTVDCLAWDCTIGANWAELIVRLRKKGYSMPIFDSMIAATAITYDITVATRNIRDFQKAGVRVVDPFV